MSVQIDIVSQRSMDLFYQNFKSNSDFFELEDFQAHCAGVVSDIYRQDYLRMKAEMRSEKVDEVVSFDPGILVRVTAEVKYENNEAFAILPESVMSFPYDNQASGIQAVLPISPIGLRFERTTAAGLYQLDYVPTVPIAWFYQQGERVWFKNKSNSRLAKVAFLIVPGIGSDKMLVSDGIVEFVITNAAATIKQAAAGTVVKKAADQNPNKIIQTEADIPTPNK